MRTIEASLAGAVVAAAILVAPVASAQTGQQELVKRVMGNTELSSVLVDTAPGAVSAIGLLGVAGDQVVTVDNPRDFTLALKPAKDGTALALSFNPARSAITPMSMSTYQANTWARIVAGTALGWAQSTTTLNEKAYRQRAVSLETSFYLSPDDDPVLRYAKALETADDSKADDPCVLIPSQQPETKGSDATAAPAQPATPKVLPVVPAVVAGGPNRPAPGTDALAAELNKRAEECRKKAQAGARWNASRAWGSYVEGRYSPETGPGESRRLGRVLVLGISWGFGDAGAARASSVTLAGKKTWDEPTLATLDAATPVKQDSSVVTLRWAMGSASQRVLLEASHLRAADTTASSRTFKRALGVDLKIGNGTWLILRTGKQRRIDGNGDESGSSVSLSLSPSDLLKF